MSIEKTAQSDEKGRPLNQTTNKTQDGQANTQETNRAGERGADELPNAVLSAPPSNGASPERGAVIDRSPEPDERDEEKVERLKAPDWRADQPLPSARNAVDPRGENTPPELVEGEEQRTILSNKTKRGQ